MQQPSPARFTATSQAQRTAWGLGQVAEPEEVRPGLWAVGLPIPAGNMPSSFGYAFIDGPDVHLVDPGWRGDRVVGVWERFLRDRGRDLAAIRTIVMTHSHPDHLGSAEALRQRSGASVVFAAREGRVLNAPEATEGYAAAHQSRLLRWGVPAEVRAQLTELKDEERPSAPILADLELHDRDRLDFGVATLTARLTPGHTGGHTCFVAESLGVLLSGDHVLPQINPGLGLGSLPGDMPVIDYLESLEAMREFDHLEALPGHEYRFRGLGWRGEQIAAHHLRRTRAVAELRGELGDAPVWEYAKRSPWSRGFDGMRGFLLVSALMQTELHLEAVRSGRADAWLADARFAEVTPTAAVAAAAAPEPVPGPTPRLAAEPGAGPAA